MPDRPNILIFMTDQQRGDTVLPTSKVRTPRLDLFAAEGVTFTNTFCSSPHCCPSRATFFTGLYPSQHGVWHNVNVPNAITRGLRPGLRLWSDDLRENGYALHWFGDWHVSDDEGPVDRGWTEHVITSGPKRISSRKGSHTDWAYYEEIAAQSDSHMRGPGQILRPGYGTFTLYGQKDDIDTDTDWKLADDAVVFLETGLPEATPWCMYVGTKGPHDPYVVPEVFLEPYAHEEIALPPSFHDSMTDKPALYRRTRSLFDQLSEEEHREAIRHYYAYCSYEDHLFGRILDALDASGQRDNTIVLYCADHGDYCAEHGLWTKGLPCFRGAYHIPAVLRWPDGIADAGRQVHSLVSNADFAPTLLEAAGLNPTASRGDAVELKPSGASLLPFLRNETITEWREQLYTQTNGNELYGIQRAVFDGNWRFVYNAFDFDELYDLHADPDETVNLAMNEKFRAKILEYSRMLWAFAAAHEDTCTNPYIMVSLASYGPAYAFRSE